MIPGKFQVLSLDPILYCPKVENCFNLVRVYIITTFRLSFLVQFFDMKCFFLFFKQWK